jgi:hypothetical protein
MKKVLMAMAIVAALVFCLSGCKKKEPAPAAPMEQLEKAGEEAANAAEGAAEAVKEEAEGAQQ